MHVVQHSNRTFFPEALTCGSGDSERFVRISKRATPAGVCPPRAPFREPLDESENLQFL